ncbi:MAG TPA: hypothetical protein PKA28_06175 [Methylomusa anaerophila]|uniref:Uncharacterized protein n=1 Tax=Methylomusa anaerophila TaxID=1930071 RepID=A0A348ALM0_9FIRM|nr:hypothetical protein [Methylomusa anaerophila]BBB91968.1 hypothetical protein MAMMFC1_02653 [Methylomusa anaerophila]HML88020.1 hypothetical protein [Methylomusa anaerophila]
MHKHWKPFLGGAVVMLAVVAGVYLFLSKGNPWQPTFLKSETPFKQETPSMPEVSPNPADINIPPDAVTITPLPSLRILQGDKVSFEGKKELRQVIAGRLAQGLVVVNFQATGEHAEKSAIRIVWENGEVEMIYPGTIDRKLMPEKRAKEITILGYSMNERRVFQDLPRKGSLTWEIRYQPVEI